MTNLEQLWADSRKREEKERNSWYITDIGRCPKGVYLERTGAKPDTTLDERTLRVFEVGDLFESKVIEVVRASGLNIETQGSITYPDVRGRYDLFIKDDPQLVEIKTMHSRGFWWLKKRGFKPLEHHVGQVMLYMHKLREEYPTLQASILYISKDDLMLQQCLVEYDPIHAEQLLEHFRYLTECYEKKTPPYPTPSVEYDTSKGKWVVAWKAKYCPYHIQCTQDIDWEVKANLFAKEKNYVNVSSP